MGSFFLFLSFCLHFCYRRVFNCVCVCTKGEEGANNNSNSKNNNQVKPNVETLVIVGMVIMATLNKHC